MDAPSAYRDYEQEASELVQRVLQTSIDKLCEKGDERRVHAWPASGEFTPDEGLRAVAEFVRVSCCYGNECCGRPQRHRAFGQACRAFLCGLAVACLPVT